MNTCAPRLLVRSLAPLLLFAAWPAASISKAAESVELPAGADSADFSHHWKFKRGEQRGADAPDFDDSTWRSLSVPHDWSIEQDFDPTIPPAMGKLPAGVGWYRKSFTLPDEAQGRKISVHFDGVYMDSTVYLNGRKLGRYPYGYTPFSYELTDGLLDGGKENVIAVRIDSPLGYGRNSSRWYAGAGINREVSLSFDRPVHLERDGIRITDGIAGMGGPAGFIRKNDESGDPLKPAQLAEVKRCPETENVATRVRAEAVNASDQPIEVRLKVTLRDYAKGEILFPPFQSSEPVKIPAGEMKELDLAFDLPEVRLWDLETPELYSFQVDLLDASDQVLSSRRVRYGFRRLTYTNKDGFFLNGRYMKLRGVCLHSDQGALGMVSNLAAMRRQIRIMKEMGSNAIRTSHNPPPANFLRACDEQGMMVMEEWFDTWFAAKNSDDYHLHFDRWVPTGPEETHPRVEPGMKWSDYDILRVARRDRNCPSVIMWSIGNEIYDTNNPRGLDAARRLIHSVRQHDDTRAITQGFPMWGREGQALDRRGTYSSQVADLLDLVGMNYPGDRYASYQFKPHAAGWIIFGSETASAWKSRGYFANRAGNLEEFGLGKQMSSLDNATHFTSQTVEWLRDRDCQPCLGQFIWTGFDYIGEPQPYDRGPDAPKSSYYGSVDTCGFPKAEFYMLQSQWLDPAEHPMVKIVNHINLDNPLLRDLMSGDGGRSVQLWVSSNLKSVGLWVVDEDGSETPIERVKDWDQGPSPNPVLAKQEPTGNPPSYESKLYQVFTVAYERVAGRKVVARGFDKPARQVGGTDKDKGAAVATDTVAYAAGASHISLKPERRAIRADGHDLCYVVVDVTDSRGNLDPNASNPITFSIEGEGEIVGVDNGDPTSMERYKAREGETWQRRAFNGKALVIVRSTTEAGRFVLGARSPGLFSAQTAVFTGNPGDPVRHAADTVSLSLPYDTTKDQLPSRLPATVTLHASDGSKLEAGVTWDTAAVTDDQLGHDNVLRLGGEVDGHAGITTEAMVSLTGEVIETIEGMSSFTGVGELPELPSRVDLVSSLGSRRSLPVAWDEAFLDVARYDGSRNPVEVEGTVTVDGEPRKVVCSVRVFPMDGAAGSDEVINVALAGNGGAAVCSYEEGATKAEYTNDGVVDKRCWGNFQAFGMIRSGDYLQYDFGLATVDMVRFVALNYDVHRAFAVPQKVTVRYLTPDGYRDVPEAVYPESYLGWDGRGDFVDRLNDIDFAPVRTRSIRIIFDFPTEPDHNVPEATGRSQIKVGIAEVSVQGKRIPYARLVSSKASVASVTIGGEPFEEFVPVRLDYEVRLPKGTTRAPELGAVAAHNSRLTIVPTHNPYGFASIEATSEDGSTTRVYNFRFTVDE